MSIISREQTDANTGLLMKKWVNIFWGMGNGEWGMGLNGLRNRVFFQKTGFWEGQLPITYYFDIVTIF
jgi:hypothetical protein